MTANGECYKCGKLANHFHYNQPYQGAGHDGFWHCAEHGPRKQTVFETAVDFSNREKPLTAGMNRAERRFFKRKGRLPND